MRELTGVLAAVASSALGGTSVGATRFVMPLTDPVTLGVLRFGFGCCFLLPLALWQRSRWPLRRDWPAVAGLGLLFFALFPVLFNGSLAYTSAARGALALSTLPLITMLVAAWLKVEPLTMRKGIGVLIAMLGVASALLSSLETAPAHAWRGDLLMVGAALCMGTYSVLSRPIIDRSSPLGFTIVAMAAGTVVMALLSWSSGGFHSMSRFGSAQWMAVAYLGVFGSALTFFLWALALAHTTPTRVAVSVTVNPVTASIVGAVFLHEPIRRNALIGLAAVLAGIGIATSRSARSSQVTTPEVQ